MTLSDRLRRYNRWRRGDKRLKQPDPTALGELIDAAADRLEVLERAQATLGHKQIATTQRHYIRRGKLVDPAK